MLLASGVGAWADDALGRFTARVASSRAEFDYSFSAGRDTRMTGSGRAVIQDDCFLVRGDGLEMYCNGKEIWTVDPDAGEVIVESLEVGGTAANPVYLITYLDQAFKVRSSQNTTLSGKAAVKYVLSPRGPVEGIEEISVWVSPDGSSLQMMRTVTEDGTVTVFTIPSFKFLQKSSSSSEFVRSERSFPDSYIITDLR